MYNENEIRKEIELKNKQHKSNINPNDSKAIKEIKRFIEENQEDITFKKYGLSDLIWFGFYYIDNENMDSEYDYNYMARVCKFADKSLVFDTSNF